MEGPGRGGARPEAGADPHGADCSEAGLGAWGVRAELGAGVGDDDGGRCAGEEEDGLVLMILLSSHKG